MYGTVARFRVKPGQEQAMLDLLKEETSGVQPKGFVGMHTYKLDSDPNEYVMAVLFTDKAAYHANANEPAQDRWYRRWRDLLEADPVWSDGEVVYQEP